jgi:hypothetical protein
MKACQNPECVVRGRVVYTLATRCPLCKWDLGTGAEESTMTARKFAARKSPLSARSAAQPRTARPRLRARVAAR